MKSLFYKDVRIDFNSPDKISFNNLFDKNLYSLFHKKLPNNGDYKIYFNTDEITIGGLGIDLIEMFKASEIGRRFKKLEAEGGSKLDGQDLKRFRNQQIIRSYLFETFPEFVGLFRNNITKKNHCIENAKLLLNLEKIDINNFIKVKTYTNQLYRSTWNRPQNLSEKNSGVSTVGEISESLVQSAFSELVDNKNFFSSRSNDAIKSYGDFVLMCLPNNLWLSVKSGFSRERLLASGYANDILGVGFFEEFKEFTSDSKNRNFKKVGFLAIYCPDIPVSVDQIKEGISTYEQVENFYKNQKINMPENINGKPFIRKLSNIKNDISSLLIEKDIKRRSTIGF